MAARRRRRRSKKKKIEASKRLAYWAAIVALSARLRPTHWQPVGWILSAT